MDVQVAELARLLSALREDHERVTLDHQAKIATLSRQIDAMSAQTRLQEEWDEERDEERANNRETTARLAARNREAVA
jgi:hypothetical protein